MLSKRNHDWEKVDPAIVHGLRKYYPFYSQNCRTQDFPRNCPVPELLSMRGQAENYSCSLEMAHLALSLQSLADVSDEEIVKTIKLSSNGADQWDLFSGLLKLGVECRARENSCTKELKEKLVAGKAVYIWSGQQPYESSRRDLVETKSGHYMAACCEDDNFVYFADPGYPEGKTKILSKYLDLLWHDVEMATRRIVYGFMIEIPIMV